MSLGSNFQQSLSYLRATYPGMIGLFLCGDFYEAFCEDAEKLQKILGLTVTSRGKDFPMAGFPRHSLEVNIRKLLEAGERVAILEQAK